MKAVRYTELGLIPHCNVGLDCIYVPERRAVYFLHNGKITGAWPEERGIRVEDCGKRALSSLEKGETEYRYVGWFHLYNIRRTAITKSRLEEMIVADKKAKEEQRKSDRIVVRSLVTA